jgi:hypothetical protein
VSQTAGVHPDPAVTAPAFAPALSNPSIRWAVAGSFLVNVVGMLAIFLPGGDDAPAGVIVMGFVFAAIALVGAWGLAQGRRWGARTTLVVTVVNALMSIPGVFVWPSTAIGIAIIVGLVVSVGVVVLLRRPDVRAELR